MHPCLVEPLLGSFLEELCGSAGIVHGENDLVGVDVLEPLHDYLVLDEV